MKHRIIALLAGGLILLLAGCLSAAAAEDTRYIVYTNDVRLATAARTPDFTVVDAAELARLQRQGRVLFYEEDYKVQLFDTQPYDEPYYAEKWDLQMVNAAAAWRQNCLGAGVRVALIDSGVAAHPELENQVAARACYLTNVSADEDTIGHGTFVAGLIAAAADGGGIVGMAPGAEIVSLKCFEKDHDTVISELVDAIYDAVDLYNCKIINMSLGIAEDSVTLKNAVDYVVEKGCIVVAAVGNYGTTALYYPAAYKNVIGVGSVDAQKVHSSFSQRNDSVWLVAPGEDVISLYFANGYAINSGTSFSAPIVSGAAALLLQLAPDADVDFFMDLFSRCSDDLGASGYDALYGHGLLNIERCVNSLLHLPGDLNDDGQITILDTLRILHGVLNREGALSLPLGDLNGDGRLSLADVLRCLKQCVI